MQIDIYLFYIVFLVSVSLILILIGVVVSYLRLVAKYISLKEGRVRNIDPLTILAEAQKKSQQIIEEANKSSLDVVKRAEIFTKDQEGRIEAALVRVSQAYAKKYGEVLGKVEEESIRMIQNIPEDIKTQIDKQVQIFKVDLQHELARTQQEIRDAMTLSYKNVEEQIGKYKVEQIARINQSIGKIVEEVSMKVLRKEISIEEHEKLVMKALEEAKRRQVL